MNKPTILDVLTTLDVSPEILNKRADYWAVVAVRNERHGRFAQAERLNANIAAMRTEARRLARLAKSEKFSSDPSKGRLARALVSRANKPAKVEPVVKPDRETRAMLAQVKVSNAKKELYDAMRAHRSTRRA
jgi:hypothetical protein